MAPFSNDDGTGTSPTAFPQKIVDRYRWSWDHLREIVRPAAAFEFWYSALYAAALTPMAAWLLNRLVVSGGLVAGDRVITRGNERLQPGQPVAGQPLEYPAP